MGWHWRGFGGPDRRGEQPTAAQAVRALWISWSALAAIAACRAVSAPEACLGGAHVRGRRAGGGRRRAHPVSRPQMATPTARQIVACSAGPLAASAPRSTSAMCRSGPLMSTHMGWASSGPPGRGRSHTVGAAAPAVGADDLRGREMSGPFGDEPCCRCLRGDRPPPGDAGDPVGKPRRRGQRREGCGRHHGNGHGRRGAPPPGSRTRALWGSGVSRPIPGPTSTTLTPAARHGDGEGGGAAAVGRGS